MPKKSTKNSFFYTAIAIFFFLFAVSFIKTIPERACANTKSCKTSMDLAVENGSEGTFGGQKIKVPDIDATKDVSSKNVLGEATLSGEKHIFVDLTTQTLTAYQGDVPVFEAKVSTGKWLNTPTGEFKIWHKVRSTRMRGGEGADFYDLPNVPYVMFFYNDEIAAGRGFGFHGAYWHNNFGHPMSHGCINMRVVDAEKLYMWSDFDTKITIYGETP